MDKWRHMYKNKQSANRLNNLISLWI